MAFLLFDDIYLKKCFEERLEVSDHIHALALRIVPFTFFTPFGLALVPRKYEENYSKMLPSI